MLRGEAGDTDIGGHLRDPHNHRGRDLSAGGCLLVGFMGQALAGSRNRIRSHDRHQRFIKTITIFNFF